MEVTSFHVVSSCVPHGTPRHGGGLTLRFHVIMSVGLEIKVESYSELYRAAVLRDTGLYLVIRGYALMKGRNTMIRVFQTCSGR